MIKKIIVVSVFLALAAVAGIGMLINSSHHHSHSTSSAKALLNRDSNNPYGNNKQFVVNQPEYQAGYNFGSDHYGWAQPLGGYNEQCLQEGQSRSWRAGCQDGSDAGYAVNG